jgi:hypothetical protein
VSLVDYLAKFVKHLSTHKKERRENKNKNEKKICFSGKNEILKTHVPAIQRLTTCTRTRKLSNFFFFFFKFNFLLEQLHLHFGFGATTKHESTLLH